VRSVSECPGNLTCVSNAIEVHARRVNNLPLPGRDARSLPKRVLTSPWTWVTVAAVLVYAVCLLDVYRMFTSPNTVTMPDGIKVAEIVPAAVWPSVKYALPTLAFWIVLYLIADRFRPQRPLVWFLALGWGAAVAVWGALYVNSWASLVLGAKDPADPRPAIFIAPFVEEAMKATVLFWLAILVRYRLTSKVSLIALGGLSAAGFAFTENIVYYGRVVSYAITSADAGNADAFLMYQVLMRGVVTAFGHPLFTMMTATGLAIALRTRSKVVRILAPLAGYLLAAFGHMFFNSQATLQPDEGAFMRIYFFVLLPLAVLAVVYAVRQEITQSRLIRARLTDYVRMGWLADGDPYVFSRSRTRFRALAIALTRGWPCWLATLRLQRSMTELAYLRDAEVAGIVDDASGLRVFDLLAVIRAARPAAVDDPRGQRLNLPRLSLPGRRKRPPSAYSPDDFGNWPSPSGGTAPMTGYSAVNPLWGPPPG